jgi:hypothetical protein
LSFACSAWESFGSVPVMYWTSSTATIRRSVSRHQSDAAVLPSLAICVESIAFSDSLPYNSAACSAMTDVTVVSVGAVVALKGLALGNNRCCR